MERIELKIDSETKEVVIRTGEALPQQPPVVYNFNGNLDAPAKFENKKLIAIDNKKAIVEVNRDEKSILLQTDFQNPFGSKVKGVLALDSVFQKFRINNFDQLFNRQQIVSLLKLHSFCFENKEAHMKLVSSIVNLNANVSTDIQKGQDFRGNKTNVLNTKVSANEIPVDIKFSMPIFKGGEKVSFMANVCFDATTTDVNFWFESAELVELKNDFENKAIDEQLALLADYTIIEK